MYGGTTISSGAGERVDEFTALGISGVLAAVSLLADSVASLQLRAFEIQQGSRKSIPLPTMIADPDPESNTYELIHQIVASLALHGNAYLYTDRDNSGNVVGIVPLHPYQMQVLPTGDHMGRRYLHLGNELDRTNIQHLRWFTPPQSLTGISPLIQSRNLIGLQIAMDRHLGQFYAEGATPSSVIETPDKMTMDQARVLQGTWEATHRRHRKPAVLSGGMKWKPISASASDQQISEMREQLLRDIARIFRIPSHLIGSMGDNQTYSNVEQASLNFLTHTITPWLARIEQALSKILPSNVDVVFDFSTLLRSDAITRARVNSASIMYGVMTPNEARQYVGLEPYEGGDVFHQALPGAVTAGGELSPLGIDDDGSAPLMGVLDNHG